MGCYYVSKMLDSSITILRDKYKTFNRADLWITSSNSWNRWLTTIYICSMIQIIYSNCKQSIRNKNYLCWFQNIFYLTLYSRALGPASLIHSSAKRYSVHVLWLCLNNHNFPCKIEINEHNLCFTQRHKIQISCMNVNRLYQPTH